MKTMITLVEAFTISTTITAIWWYFLRPRYIWSPDKESRFKEYTLFQARWILGGKLMLKKEILFPFYCEIIEDKDGDGVADYKVHIVSAGRASRRDVVPLEEIDKEAYAYAVEHKKRWR